MTPTQYFLRWILVGSVALLPIYALLILIWLQLLCIVRELRK